MIMKKYSWYNYIIGLKILCHASSAFELFAVLASVENSVCLLVFFDELEAVDKQFRVAFHGSDKLQLVICKFKEKKFEIEEFKINF